MHDREARSRLDGTQLGVAVLAWFVGGWRLMGLLIAVMFVWAFLTYLFVGHLERRRATEKGT